MSKTLSEVDQLDPQGTSLKLRSGRQVLVVRLRMRQLFALLRIVSRGGAPYLPQLKAALEAAPQGQASEAFAMQLLAIVLVALPEAEEEAIAFVASVVESVDGDGGELAAELKNPDLDDVVSILECVVAAEKDDFVALGKRLAAMWRAGASSVTRRTAQTSSEVSLARSTSSPQNTDGAIPTSSTSQSPG